MVLCETSRLRESSLKDILLYHELIDKAEFLPDSISSALDESPKKRSSRRARWRLAGEKKQ